MVDVKQLASSLSGMSPEQALQTSQMNVTALQNQQQMQQQQQQFDQRQKLEQMNMALRAALEKRRSEIQERQLVAEEAYRKEQTAVAKEQAEKLRFENQMMDQAAEQTVQTKLGPMRGDLALAYQSMGMPLFTDESSLQWKIETIDGKSTAVIMDGQGQVTTKPLGDADVSDEISKKFKAAEDTILSDFGASSFSGLKKDVREVARSSNELAMYMLQQDPDMEGKEAANSALWVVEKRRSALQDLRSLRINQKNRAAVIEQLKPLVRESIQLEDRLASPLFSGKQLEETLVLAGASPSEAQEMLRSAYLQLRQEE
jgi:hypothetical protein